jgi:hypothetical protein
MSDAMADAKGAIDSAGFSTPQGMVAAGALVLLAVEVVFGLILYDYFNSFVVLVLSVIAVLIFLGRTATAEKIGPVPAVMKALGYTLAIYGAWVLVYDLRDAGEAFDNAGDIIASLLSYAGYALAFLGARGIKV